jgi:CelD/BcsL family acetyltransferase involved in cellulose biosynthesis
VRRIQRRGGGFSVVRSPGHVVELLEELMDLHNQRFAAISAVFATAARRRFHLLAAQRMADAGMVRIYRLVAEGRNVGLQCGLALGDRVFF